jgi:hypothetical protein
MPNLDRTGPRGEGLMTGRRLGKCGEKSKEKDLSREERDERLGLGRGGRPRGLGLGRRGGRGLGRNRRNRW